MAAEDMEHDVQKDPEESTAGTQENNDQEQGSTETSPEEELVRKDEEITQLKQELSDLKDQYLRKQADMDNFRKRLLREKEESIAFANRQLLLDLVTIIDDFERAIKSSESARDFDSLHDGIVMIEKQFVGMLERKWNLVRFESEGEEFDPNRHEAVMVEEVPEHHSQMVLQDFQKGYMLKDSVLRTAKVKVSQPGSPAPVESQEQ